jgi:tetratricopeptide (TPR) repeat protein
MKAYIDQRHIKECWFAYVGALPVDVSYYGIPCKGLPTSFANLIQLPMPVVPPEVEGPVFISATELAGTYWRADWTNPYLPFQRMPPSALIADSILVYDGKVDTSEVSALTHENLALQLLRARKLDQALAEAQTAIEIAPNRPAAHAARSTILAAAGRTAEAVEEIARARMIADAIVAAR